MKILRSRVRRHSPLALAIPPVAREIGAIGTATIQITDDAIEPTTNVNDDPATFVGQHYHDFLNRQHDPAGLAFWVNQITSCGGDQECIAIRRINVSAAFFLSIEFQETGFFVIRAQRVAFGRKSDTAASRFSVSGVHQGCAAGREGRHHRTTGSRSTARS